MKLLVRTAVGALTLLIAGCGGGVRRSHYYALDLPTPPEPVRLGYRIAGTIAVCRFETPPYLRQGRIVYRESPEEIGFYEYQRWADEPAETVTTAMVDTLRSSRLFSVVKRYDGHNQQDYLLVGRLERLEELDYGGPVRVEATISAEIINLRTGTTEWSDKSPVTTQVENRSADSVIRAMNHSVQDSINQLMASVDQQLSSK